MKLAGLLSGTKVVSILYAVRISHICQHARKAIRKETLRNSHARMAVPMESLYAFQIPEGEHSKNLVSLTVTIYNL